MPPDSSAGRVSAKPPSRPPDEVDQLVRFPRLRPSAAQASAQARLFAAHAPPRQGATGPGTQPKSPAPRLERGARGGRRHRFSRCVRRWGFSSPATIRKSVDFSATRRAGPTPWSDQPRRSDRSAGPRLRSTREGLRQRGADDLRRGGHVMRHGPLRGSSGPQRSDVTVCPRSASVSILAATVSSVHQPKAVGVGQI